MPPEHRKAENRARIATAAMELFAARGFERVSVTEVAAAAGVTEKTVFNHFATKEDLVYSGDEEFERALLEAVRNRSAGDSYLAAVRRFLLLTYGRGLPDENAMRHARTLAVLVSQSPALQRREREILSRYADRLREELAQELGHRSGALAPAVLAGALMGVHQAVIREFRRGLLDDEPVAALVRRVLASAAEAFDLLANGFASLSRDAQEGRGHHHGTTP